MSLRAGQVRPAGSEAGNPDRDRYERTRVDDHQEPAVAPSEAQTEHRSSVQKDAVGVDRRSVVEKAADPPAQRSRAAGEDSLDRRKRAVLFSHGRFEPKGRKPRLDETAVAGNQERGV